MIGRGAPFSCWNECIPTELLAVEPQQTWSGYSPTVNQIASRCSLPPCIVSALFALLPNVSERLTSAACNISPLAAASSCELHVAVCFASSNTPHHLLPSLTLSLAINLSLSRSLFFLPSCSLLLSTSTSEWFSACWICRAEWHAIVIMSHCAALSVQT